MSKFEKMMQKIASGTADTNIPFKDLCWILQKLDFEEHINGSHHIFSKRGINELVNLQYENANAKSYQVKQVRKCIIKYKLGGK